MEEQTFLQFETIELKALKINACQYQSKPEFGLAIYIGNALIE
jgi:hypothetical protein